MKHSPSLFLPLILLAFIAATTFWLSQQAQQGEARPARAPAHIADATAENFVVRRFDETGRLKYQLAAPHLTHYPDNDASEIRTPVLTAFRPDALPITLSADHALVTSKGEIIYLTDNVKIVRPTGQNRPDLIARMPDLTVETETEQAHTDSRVLITQGVSHINGVGMHLDNHAATLTLKSQVRGEYIRPQPTP
ncbi:MAG: LPS export ABC transporter periplasmic protein LptC [Rhodocyclales bacterium]|nr:LPS export ABC transporter periplasmic protein LptC [Rhodocyclales bacterium]